ncbi:MAG: diadenylate cyclase [Desulfobacterales bacterium]|nr:diadenylate cyclase [Desulfobacterales bacterium]
MYLIDLIPTPMWRDIVDILFLTVVAYQLYVWFRESRALRVIIGLVALGGVYSLAKLWDLYLTTWVFQILWQVLLILLLILFQSEIRQVLERVSPMRYLRSRRRAFKKTFGRELSQLLFEMADDRTGALLVLARNDNPSEFIHAGQTIMALPDPALIKSIFNRYAPAHDGAIIINQDRITQMGCILPLSENENLPTQYGTRHRAALGLSEVTDAVCLVVSEERSEVATVSDGKIVTWQDPDALTAHLNEVIGGPQINVPALKDFLKGLLIENWRVKLSALALVTIAWVALASQQESELTVAVPVQHTNMPSQLVIGQGSTPTVDLTLSGRRNKIRTLRDQDVQVSVDLSNFDAGKHQVRLSAKNIFLPFGVKIDQVAPQKILVSLQTQSESQKSNENPPAEKHAF